jgi:hypothetical protein
METLLYVSPQLPQIAPILLRKSRAGFGDGRDKIPYPHRYSGGNTVRGGRAPVVPDPD